MNQVFGLYFKTDGKCGVWFFLKVACAGRSSVSLCLASVYATKKKKLIPCVFVFFLRQAALTLLVNFQNNEMKIFLLLQDPASKLRQSGLAASS